MTVKLIAIALLLAVMALLLRSFGFRGAGVFATLGVISLVSLAVGELSVLGELLGESSLFDGESIAYVGAIVKIIGVGYIFGFGADICTELGEPGIANGVIVAGRVEIFLLTLPYFKQILDIGTELLQ